MTGDVLCKNWGGEEKIQVTPKMQDYATLRDSFQIFWRALPFFLYGIRQSSPPPPPPVIYVDYSLLTLVYKLDILGIFPSL